MSQKPKHRERDGEKMRLQDAKVRHDALSCVHVIDKVISDALELDVDMLLRIGCKTVRVWRSRVEWQLGVEKL